ncbi:MAG: SCP2 sterol-binding domain-containing protein [Sphingomonadales bacterium]
MSLQEATQLVRDKIGESCGIPNTMKIDFGDDGIIFIDGTATPNVISNDDDPSDVTIKVDIDDYMQILEGSLDAQMAFMTGKLKLEGNMGVAMQFANAMRG